MTEAEIKDFFMVTEKNKASYEQVRNSFTADDVASNPEALIVALLKKTYGYPISFFDSGKEDNFTLTEKRSDQIYEEFAEAINFGDYESLYDFTQDFSYSLPTE